MLSPQQIIQHIETTDWIRPGILCSDRVRSWCSCTLSVSMSCISGCTPSYCICNTNKHTLKRHLNHSSKQTTLAVTVIQFSKLHSCFDSILYQHDKTPTLPPHCKQ